MMTDLVGWRFVDEPMHGEGVSNSFSGEGCPSVPGAVIFDGVPGVLRDDIEINLVDQGSHSVIQWNLADHKIKVWRFSVDPYRHRKF